MKSNREEQNTLLAMSKRKAANKTARIISITSGKGGVGKTSIACSLGVALSEIGNRVLLFDADCSLANVDVVLGIRPKGTLQQVLEGSASLRDILIETPSGLDIIPSASGVEALSSLTTAQRLVLRQAFEEIAGNYDYILIDTAAGIGSDVMFFNQASQEVVCVVNAEPTSLTDAYALIKVLSKRYAEKKVSILVNNVRDQAEATRTFIRLQSVVERFLHISLKSLGFVPTDSRVQEAVRARTSFQLSYPTSAAALAVSKLAKELDADFYEHGVKGGLQFLFDKLLEESPVA